MSTGTDSCGSGSTALACRQKRPILAAGNDLVQLQLTCLHLQELGRVFILNPPSIVQKPEQKKCKDFITGTGINETFFY